jgi:oligoribonuclease NrnB/cAMP/cGMP phosphodiesterase (DHH superfamily)
VITSKEEFKKLNPEQLEEVLTFKGVNETYFYKDIKFFKESDEYQIVLNDIIVYTSDLNKFNNIKAGKLQYDIISMFMADISGIDLLDTEKFKETVKKDLIDEVLDEVLDKMTNEVLNPLNKKLQEISNIDSKKFKTSMKDIDEIVSVFDKLLD